MEQQILLQHKQTIILQSNFNLKLQNLVIAILLLNQSYLGSKWEEFRNKQMFKSIAKQVYGKQAGVDHYLIRATQALGIPPKDLFKHISSKVKDRFERIGHKIDESLLPSLQEI